MPFREHADSHMRKLCIASGLSGPIEDQGSVQKCCIERDTRIRKRSFQAEWHDSCAVQHMMRVTYGFISCFLVTGACACKTPEASPRNEDGRREERPKDLDLTVSLNTIASWPEYAQAKITVPKLDLRPDPFKKFIEEVRTPTAEAIEVPEGPPTRTTRVGAREALAIAARNWLVAWPGDSQAVIAFGACYLQVEDKDFTGWFVGAINRGCYYLEAQAAIQLKRGGIHLEVWEVDLFDPNQWLSNVNIWIDAHTGRVVRIYGPQGLLR